MSNRFVARIQDQLRAQQILILQKVNVASTLPNIKKKLLRAEVVTRIIKNCSLATQHFAQQAARENVTSITT